MERVRMRATSHATAVGFCSKCGIVREDVEGVPVTDCVCTASLEHKPDCQYLKAVGMWISVGSCEKHGLDACEECDCTCKEKDDGRVGRTTTAAADEQEGEAGVRQGEGDGGAGDASKESAACVAEQPRASSKEATGA